MDAVGFRYRFWGSWASWQVLAVSGYVLRASLCPRYCPQSSLVGNRAVLRRFQTPGDSKYRRPRSRARFQSRSGLTSASLWLALWG